MMPRRHEVALFLLAVVLIVSAIFVPIYVVVLRRRNQRRTRELADRYGARATEDLRDAVVRCEVFDHQHPRGRLREEPQVARVLKELADGAYRSVALEFAVEGSFLLFLAMAEARVGCWMRPPSADQGQLEEILFELGWRAVRRPSDPATRRSGRCALCGRAARKVWACGRCRIENAARAGSRALLTEEKTWRD